MDGVIIDSEAVHHELERQMFAEFGIPVSVEEHHSFTGATFQAMWTALKERYGLPYSIPELRTEKRRRFYAELDSPACRVTLVPGVVDLIEQFRRTGIRRVVASSSFTDHVQMMLSRFGLIDRFDGYFGGDSVHRSKPAPDLFLHAASVSGVNPRLCLVIEDSANGVNAAKAAGMSVIGYRNPNSGEQDISKADWVIDSFGEIGFNSLQSGSQPAR
jgi:HAD superfamily hydrolase (TIGR01509 family)